MSGTGSPSNKPTILTSSPSTGITKISKGVIFPTPVIGNGFTLEIGQGVLLLESGSRLLQEQ